jgi:hypothetical protein
VPLGNRADIHPGGNEHRDGKVPQVVELKVPALPRSQWGTSGLRQCQPKLVQGRLLYRLAQLPEPVGECVRVGRQTPVGVTPQHVGVVHEGRAGTLRQLDHIGPPPDPRRRLSSPCRRAALESVSASPCGRAAVVWTGQLGPCRSIPTSPPAGTLRTRWRGTGARSTGTALARATSGMPRRGCRAPACRVSDRRVRAEFSC